MSANGPLFPAIAAAGFACGVLDGLSAVALSLLNGVAPARTFRGVAYALIGPPAMTGGAATAILGVALHFVVATAAAALYFAASRRMPVLVERALVAGILYGVLVHLFMTFVVIPLSRIGSRPLVLSQFLVQMAIHMVVVGPSIALTIQWFSRRAV